MAIPEFFSHLLFLGKDCFPFLNQKMDFAPEKEVHEIIHKGISDLEALLLEVKADISKFNPDQIKEQLVKLKVPLVSRVTVPMTNPDHWRLV